jgi:hypothetical protein
MPTASESSQKPPKIEPIKARFLMYPYQWIGLPLLLLIPILALFGVFDRNETSVTQQSDALTLNVESFTLNRYKMSGYIAVTVENTGDVPLSEVTVSVSRSYIEAFADVSTSPPITHITDEQYVFVLPALEAGQTHTIDIQFLADRYGVHKGTVEAQINAGETVQVAVQTLVLP